jgi:hypothetical protein
VTLQEIFSSLIILATTLEISSDDPVSPSSKGENFYSMNRRVLWSVSFTICITSRSVGMRSPSMVVHPFDTGFFLDIWDQNGHILMKDKNQ